MQKAKRKDLICSEDYDYIVVTETFDNFVRGITILGNRTLNVSHGEYQVVFSPGADKEDPAPNQVEHDPTLEVYKGKKPEPKRQDIDPQLIADILNEYESRRLKAKILLADISTAELREELRRRGDDVKQEDLLYCRKHGRLHNSDCDECHKWLEARMAYSWHPSTSELVAELARRVGVYSLTAERGTDYRIEIRPHQATDALVMVPVVRKGDFGNGPCTILMIREDAK